MDPEGMGGSDCAKAWAVAKTHSRSMKTWEVAVNRKRGVLILKFMVPLLQTLLLPFSS